MNFKNSSIIIRQDDKSNICLKDGGVTMEKQNRDWSNIGFGYMKTDKRYVSNFKNGASVNVQVYFSMHRHVLKE